MPDFGELGGSSEAHGYLKGWFLPRFRSCMASPLLMARYTYCSFFSFFESDLSRKPLQLLVKKVGVWAKQVGSGRVPRKLWGSTCID